MKKLEIDVLTGKIIGYSDMPIDIPQVLGEEFDACKMRKLCQNVNFPIYKDDVFVPDEEISTADVVEGKSYYIDGKIVKKEEEEPDELKELETEYAEKDALDESKYFMDLVMGGKDLDEARNSVAEHRKDLEELKMKIKTLQEEKTKWLEKYWIEKHKETDTEDYKYYVAAVLLIKNENKYLEEWLDWHIEQGFEHIYIYDNGKRERVEEIVNTHPDKEKITVIDWSGEYANIQEDAYNHFLSNYRKEVKWVLFIDSDEFFRIEAEKSLKEMLEDLEDYTEIYGYMEEYNANGAVECTEGLVRERFTEKTDVHEGIYHKNFVQANRIDSMIRHYAYYDPKKHLEYSNENQNRDLFVIEHYYTKSWEEWQEKILERGTCDPTYKRKLKEFFEYNPDMEYLNDGSNAKQKYQNK